MARTAFGRLSGDRKPRGTITRQADEFAGPLLGRIDGDHQAHRRLDLAECRKHRRRSAIGVGSLPGNITVEIEAVVEIAV